MRRRRIVWLLLILACAALYLFENGGATLALLAAVVLVPAIGILLTVLQKGRGAAQITMPDRALCGEEIRGTIRAGFSGEALLTAENPHTGEQQTQTLRLERGETAFRLRAEHCGAVRAALTELQIRDPFGLICRRMPLDVSAGTIVYPKVFEPEIILAESAFAMLDSDQYSASKPGSDPSETFAIREYIPGDSIKTIHWKLSQKTGKTMIRELSLPIVHQVLLLYDHRRAAHTAPADVHAMTTVFASVSAALSAAGVAYAVSWDDLLLSVEQEEDRIAALEALLEHRPLREAVKLHAEGTYAHVAAISPEPVPGLADQYNGSRVTVLTPGEYAEGLQSDGTYLLCFASGQPEDHLGRIEL